MPEVSFRSESLEIGRKWERFRRECLGGMCPSGRRKVFRMTQEMRRRLPVRSRFVVASRAMKPRGQRRGTGKEPARPDNWREVRAWQGSGALQQGRGPDCQDTVRGIRGRRPERIPWDATWRGGPSPETDCRSPSFRTGRGAGSTAGPGKVETRERGFVSRGRSPGTRRLSCGWSACPDRSARSPRRLVPVPGPRNGSGYGISGRRGASRRFGIASGAGRSSRIGPGFRMRGGGRSNSCLLTGKSGIGRLRKEFRIPRRESGPAGHRPGSGRGDSPRGITACIRYCESRFASPSGPIGRKAVRPGRIRGPGHSGTTSETGAGGGSGGLHIRQQLPGGTGESGMPPGPVSSRPQAGDYRLSAGGAEVLEPGTIPAGSRRRKERVVELP